MDIVHEPTAVAKLAWTIIGHFGAEIQVVPRLSKPSGLVLPSLLLSLFSRNEILLLDRSRHKPEMPDLCSYEFHTGS